MEPDARGIGTHEQLGVEACGWASRLDFPCPTCGVTTAASLAANGQLFSSLMTQPFGFLLALALAVVFWQQLGTAALSWPGPHWTRMLISGRVWTTTIILLALGWGWKILTWT
ncbi:DUF2752 domain-containing protein [Mucisphaera sp.]|uniref:DUF2752 domain-containing protein n=1 Tax=Mucisphaera sp. TaxID=2913024 RepID=UPI003D0E3668